jgi:uncharacterized protein YgiM (DUF1202 family)
MIRISIAALAAGLALIPVSAAVAENNNSGFDTPGTAGHYDRPLRESMIVDVGRGNLRERPNPQSNILTTLPRGTKVMVVGTANGGGWAHVLYDGLDGYMDFVQLEPAPPAPPEPATYRQPQPGNRVMVITADRGTLRARPTVQSQLLAVLPRGSQVNVLGTANGGGWAHVLAGNLDGYIDFVQLADVPASSYLPPPQPVNYPATQPSFPASMTVNTLGGTVHQSPDQQSPLLTALSPGTRVSVVGYAGNGRWAHVVTNGVDGYMDVSQLQ